MVVVNIEKKFLTPNPYSRPQTEIKVKGIVLHWTASPMGRNQGVWNYFERRKSGNNGYGSAHFIVDLNGEIWNCIPENEMAYHIGSKIYSSHARDKLGTYPNNSTLGIEFCVVDNRGRMNHATWKKGAKLIAYLLKRHNLTVNDIWLHQEIVGWRDCHRFFVENRSEYEKFKQDVQYRIDETNMLSNQEGRYYTVRAEDTLWSIANKFYTTIGRLKELNPNINVYVLEVGDTIIVESKERLKTSPTNYSDILSDKVLRFGDKGEDVKKLQQALNRLYFNVGIIDGIFGQSTEKALKRYQSKFFGLKVDGIFGSDTRNHMLYQLIN